MTTTCVPQSGKVDQNLEFVNIKKAISFNYTWIVSDFNLGCESFESPIFTNESNATKWRLKIKNVTNIKYTGNIFDSYNRTPMVMLDTSVHLVAISSDAVKIQADCKFQILSSMPNKTLTFKKALHFTIDTYTDCFNTKENNNLTNVENGYLQGNSIMLTCQINVKEISKQLSIPKCTVYENLDLIFKNPKFSDVTLCAGGKEFQAHKVILAARSSVFNAMFDHDMDEKKHNRVNITDIDEKVFGELLRFIYTGKVLNLKEYAIDLLPAAEKHGFEDLKVLCGNALCANISIASAAEVLVLSDMYGLDLLKAVAIGFVGAHVLDVVETAGWKSMTESRPNLITEVLRDVAKQFQNCLNN